MSQKTRELIETTEKVVENLPSDQQYGFLFEALEKMIALEHDPDILAMISTSLYELHEKALKRSWRDVIHEAPNGIH